MEESTQLSPKEMGIVTKALGSQTCIGTFLLSSVGMIRSEDITGLEEATGLLIRREGVETVIVFGVVDSKALKGKLQTTSGTVDPEKWLSSLFSHDETLEVEVHSPNEASFSADLGLLGRCKEKAALWKIVEALVSERFTEKVGVMEN